MIRLATIILLDRILMIPVSSLLLIIEMNCSTIRVIIGMVNSRRLSA